MSWKLAIACIPALVYAQNPADSSKASSANTAASDTVTAPKILDPMPVPTVKVDSLQSQPTVSTKVASQDDDEGWIDPNLSTEGRGEVRNKNSADILLSGGMANVVFGYSLVWNRILGGGIGEVSIPFTFLYSGEEPESNSANFRDPSHRLIATGLKYHSFWNKNASEWFYGGGIRVNFWNITYVTDYQDNTRKDKPYDADLVTIVPLAEVGYIYPIEAVRNLGAKGSLELGWIFVQESYEQADDYGKLNVSETMPFWTINAGITYAF